MWNTIEQGHFGSPPGPVPSVAYFLVIPENNLLGHYTDEANDSGTRLFEIAGVIAFKKYNWEIIKGQLFNCD